MGWPSVNANEIGIARLTGYDGLGLHAELLGKIGRIEIFAASQDLALRPEFDYRHAGVRDAPPDRPRDGLGQRVSGSVHSGRRSIIPHPTNSYRSITPTK